uniref:CHASE domain-containing protein n=1 Tax=Lactuca sativa TaxID=4236 RepID=A0A9R1WRK5_LACSA|nr:hypothetical protein LSAT_V11C900457350 [Lactuca sativa]
MNSGIIIVFIQILLQENVTALIECVKKDIGFSQGKPVAAFTIYKSLIQWKSFEAERSSVFDRLIQTIGLAIKETFAEYTARTAFERPLLSGVANAQRVMNYEREDLERQHDGNIRTMTKEPSPFRDGYAPVIFAQETVSYLKLNKQRKKLSHPTPATQGFPTEL